VDWIRDKSIRELYPDVTVIRENGTRAFKEGGEEVNLDENAITARMDIVGPMDDWEKQMARSDSTLMPRWMEVHIEQEHGGVVADATLQQKYNDKKALRAGRPA